MLTNYYGVNRYTCMRSRILVRRGFIVCKGEATGGSPVVVIFYLL